MDKTLHLQVSQRIQEKASLTDTPNIKSSSKRDSTIEKISKVTL